MSMATSSTTVSTPAPIARSPHRTRRRVGFVVLAAGALLLTSCREITLDYKTHATHSDAVAQIDPTTMSVGGQTLAAIDISLTDCRTIQITNMPGAGGSTVTQTLPRARPTAVITDANNQVVFNSLYVDSGFYPGNAQWVTSSTGPDHLRIPVAGMASPLTITAGCTTYVGHGLTKGLTWNFQRCTTWTRTCPATSVGSIQEAPSPWLWNR